jgi:hypothetical protein
METRKTQRELLQNLVVSGKITEDEAREVRQAPEWTVSIRELVVYLGGLFVAAGVIRIAIYAFEDASALIVALVLYLVATVCGFFGFRLQKKSGAFRRFGEILELATMLTGALATGIVLTDAGIRSEISAIICSAVTFAWSMWRLRSTTLIGAIGAIPSVFVASIMVTTLSDSLQSQPPYVIGLAGAVLVGIGLAHVPLAVLFRAIGLILVAQVAIDMGAHHNGGAAVIVPIGIGIIAFAYGGVKFAVEMLIIGAIMIVVGVVMFVVSNITNDVMQGVVISAVGLALLLVSYVVITRNNRAQA